MLTYRDAATNDLVFAAGGNRCNDVKVANTWE
jgi:hypothetical protein